MTFMKNLKPYKDNTLQSFLYCVVLIDVLLILMNLIGLRLENIFGNSLVLSLVYITLLTALIVLCSMVEAPQKFYSLMNRIFVVLLIIVLVIVGLVGISNLREIHSNGYLPGLVPLQSIKVDGDKSILVYQVNGGATTDYAVKIYENNSLLPGLIQIKLIKDYYHVRDIELEYIGENKLLVKQIVLTTSATHNDHLPKSGDTISYGD